VLSQGTRDAVRFGLMFAYIHYKFKSSQAPETRRQRSRHTVEKKTEFNVKWSFNVMYLVVGKDDKGLNNTI